jgi:hypothetical protein
MSDCITVRVDDENNAEAWWDALSETMPGLASALRVCGEVTVDVATWGRLTALPGWDGGPEYAPHPLTWEARP